MIYVYLVIILYIYIPGNALKFKRGKLICFVFKYVAKNIIRRKIKFFTIFTLDLYLFSKTTKTNFILHHAKYFIL